MERSSWPINEKFADETKMSDVIIIDAHFFAKIVLIGHSLKPLITHVARLVRATFYHLLCHAP